MARSRPTLHREAPAEARRESPRRTGALSAAARLGKGAVARWNALLGTLWFPLAVLFTLGSAALLPWGLLFARGVAVDAIADRDYIAPHDLLLPDDETTLERQQKARDEVLPIYDYDPGPAFEPKLAGLLATVREVAAEGGTAESLVTSTSLKLSEGAAALLLRKGTASEFEERLRSLVAQLVRRGMVAAKEQLLEHRLHGISVRNLGSGLEAHSLDLYAYLAFPAEVRDLVEADVRDWSGLTAAERRVMTAFLLSNMEPNLHFNKSETVLRQEEAALAAPPSLTQVRRGQVIARRGDQLSAAAVRQIMAYRSGMTSLPKQLPPILGVWFLLGGAALVSWLSLAGEVPAGRSRRRPFSESLLLLAVSLALCRGGWVISEALASTVDTAQLAMSLSFAVPFGAFGLAAALLLGRRRALALAPLFALLVSRLAGHEGLWLALYTFGVCLAAIYALDQYPVQQRLVMTRAGLLVGAVGAGITLLSRALDGTLGAGVLEVLADLGAALVGGIVAAAVASFIVPIFEAAFGIATDIKLAELANTNLPLLRRLAYEAPGTFQHSLMVANLAKRASEAIAADAPLAYTAGLYHDVGKVLRPDYFVENQRSGQNPHDKLQPTMSALILINHIKDGRELAREHHLPQVLVDAIEQHHGTRLIKYFWSRAAATHDRAGAGELSEEKFRYPGPRPQSKVMGILMLADAVEAASRTLVAPTVPKVRALIRTIVEDCLTDRQLEETDLTLADLARVSESFLEVLTTIFHQRVDYPGYDFNAPPAPRREGRVIPLLAGRQG